jgi:23S rRNA (adenine2503-C2)-methyltransferase
MLKNILHLTKEELKEILTAKGEKDYRATQIWKWIYLKGVFDFDLMSDISLKTREMLKQNFTLQLPEVSKDLTSFDGTRKFLVKFFDATEVEAVFIPEHNAEKYRGTLCISSQVGCTLACKFCHTGTQTWVRNLEFYEIIAQILIAKNLINDWNQEKKLLTNIVFMGMGEPFFNYENVAKAVKIMTDEQGLHISNKKTTISTSGLINEIIRCGEELKTNLAISLHATNDELRTEIMAINKKYPLDDLMKACQKYHKLNPNQKITFEYVMLKGVNDSGQNAYELINLIKKYQLNVKINLIPFNPWQGCEYSNSEIKVIEEFQKILKDAEVVSPIRKTRGDDVMAACGQLKSDTQRQRKKI